MKIIVVHYVKTGLKDRAINSPAEGKAWLVVVKIN
jgi:hypothetical protein